MRNRGAECHAECPRPGLRAQMSGWCCEREGALPPPGLNVASGHRGVSRGPSACCSIPRRAGLGVWAVVWASCLRWSAGCCLSVWHRRAQSGCGMSGGALAHDSASPMHARRVSAGCGLRPGGGGGGGRGLVVGGRGSWGSVREGTGRGYAPCVRDRGPRLHFTSLPNFWVVVFLLVFVLFFFFAPLHSSCQRQPNSGRVMRYTHLTGGTALSGVVSTSSCPPRSCSHA